MKYNINDPGGRSDMRKMTTVAMKALPRLVALSLVIALASCDQTKQAQKPASFRDNIFASVTPTADGDAYAIGDSALWYLRRSSSVKVRFSNLPIDTDNRFFATLEITPLLDGGAYAYSTADKSAFWYIHADIAERVTEVSSLSSVAPVAPISAFPLYIAERQKRLQAEEELEERSNPTDDEPAGSDY